MGQISFVWPQEEPVITKSFKLQRLFKFTKVTRAFERTIQCSIDERTHARTNGCRIDGQSDERTSERRASSSSSSSSSSGARVGFALRCYYHEIYLSMVLVSVLLGTAPTTLSLFSPLVNTNTVGMDRIPYLVAMSGLSSVFSFRHRTLPAYCFAISSIIGAIMRHGPHHGAQKSTNTGVSQFNTSSVHVASVTALATAETSMQQAQWSWVRPLWDSSTSQTVTVNGVTMLWSSDTHSMVSKQEKPQCMVCGEVTVLWGRWTTRSVSWIWLRMNPYELRTSSWNGISIHPERCQCNSSTWETAPQIGAPLARNQDLRLGIVGYTQFRIEALDWVNPKHNTLFREVRSKHQKKHALELQIQSLAMHERTCPSKSSDRVTRKPWRAMEIYLQLPFSELRTQFLSFANERSLEMKNEMWGSSWSTQSWGLETPAEHAVSHSPGKASCSSKPSTTAQRVHF